ncbi:hypothetical protein PAXRUDRAFT_168737, partial [Paxillus rubicundulus Ve08.2h10]
EAEKQEKDKMKMKMNGLNAEVMVQDNLLPFPSQYVIQKLRSFEFVKLWYFTLDGCSFTFISLAGHKSIKHLLPYFS